MVERTPTGRVTRWVLAASIAGVALLAGVPLFESMLVPAPIETPTHAARAPRFEPALVASVLAILAPPETGPGSVPAPQLDQLVARIVKLGPAAIDPLLALMCGDISAPEFAAGSADLPVHPRAIELRSAVLATSLARFKDCEVLPRALDYAGRDAALDVKLVIVRLLGLRASAEALPAVFTTLADVEPIHFERAFVQASIEPALASLLERDPRRIAGVERSCRRELLPSLVRAAGRVRSSATIAWLAAQLGSDDALELTLLVELGRAGEGGRLALPDQARRRLRDSLTQASDERRRVAAAMLGKLRDEAAFDELVGLLDDADVLLVAAARGALTALVGQDLGPGADAWYDWRVAQDAWYGSEAPVIYEELFDADPALAAHAMGELLTHSFFRHEAAEAIGERLSDAQDELFTTGCSALTVLGSARAIAGLVQALERGDEAQRESACAALRSLTGLDLPPEHSLWVAALER